MCSISREEREVDSGRDRADSGSGSVVDQLLPVHLGDRDGETGAVAGPSFVVPQLAPFDLEQRATPWAALDVAQPLPNQMFDVVIEEDCRNGPVRGDVDGRREKISHAYVHGTRPYQRGDGVAECGNSPPREIDGKGRKPGAH